MIFDAEVLAGFKTTSKLNVNSETEIYHNILLPDLAYHNRNTIYAGGNLTYTFPLQFVKSSKLTGYAKLYGGNIFTTGNIGWYNAGVAIGLLTL